MRIEKVTFDGKTFELAIPVYLSDDEVQFAKRKYDCEEAATAANVLFVFNIIQKQIEQLMADKEENNDKKRSN